MDLADIIQSAISALPDELKATAVFSRVIPGTYDPATDKRAGDVTEEFTVTGPLASVQPDQLPVTAADQLTRLRDLTVAAADCDFVPSPTDSSCTINGESWRVVSADPVDPSGAAPAALIVRLHR